MTYSSGDARPCVEKVSLLATLALIAELLSAPCTPSPWRMNSMPGIPRKIAFRVIAYALAGRSREFDERPGDQAKFHPGGQTKLRVSSGDDRAPVCALPKRVRDRGTPRLTASRVPGTPTLILRPSLRAKFLLPRDSPEVRREPKEKHIHCIQSRSIRRGRDAPIRCLVGALRNGGES